MGNVSPCIQGKDILLAKGRKKKGFFYYLLADWEKYLMLLLPLTIVFIFSYIPMYGIVIAFQKYNVFKGVFNSPWVGFDNFIHVFSLPRFSRVLRNTIVLNLAGMIVGFPFPIVLAIMLSEMRSAKIVKVVQTVSYLPHFLSTVIIGGIIFQLCAPQDGLINQFVVILGGKDIPFLTSPLLWICTYVGSDILAGMGWGSIIYIAAIAGINPELFEAAKVDGAKRLQKIWHITLPCIKPIILLMLILSMGGIISSSFDKPYIFTNPMVSDVSEVISLFVYYVGLGQGDFTMATVVGLFQSVVGASMVAIVNRIVKAFGEDGLW